MDPVTIIDLKSTDRGYVAAVADILLDSFADFAPAYLPTVDDALEEVEESLGEGRLSRVLLAGGRLVGWIGGVHLYGRLWELHPLAIVSSQRRQGYGRLLVDDLARQVAGRGGLTLLASTSDETDRTTLYGKDLYADPISALRELRSVREHPIDFYQRVGFSLVGLMPDAEGPGKPSIHLARRV